MLYIPPTEALPAAELTLRQNQARRNMAGFLSTASAVDFPETAVLPGDAKRRRPKGIDAFSIGPLHVGPVKYDYQNRVIRSVNTYKRILPHRRFYADADYAVALYKETGKGTVACATACMGIGMRTGRLLITQIQGISNSWSGRPEGMHDGFLWRHTLVAAMADIACRLGEPEIEILSAKNNPWNKATPEGYDVVAEQLGFTQIPLTSNWGNSLPLNIDPNLLPRMHKEKPTD